MHIGTTWWIRLNRPCAVAVRPCQTTWPLVIVLIKIFMSLVLRLPPSQVGWDNVLTLVCLSVLPLVLWHCWLGIRKSIRPVKKWMMRCWHGYLSGARCKWFAYGPADATATHSIISCFVKIQIGLTFLVPAYQGCPRKEGVKHMSCLVYLCLFASRIT